MSSYQALKFMLFSTFAFACMNVTVKYLDGFSAAQIVFLRSVGSLFFTFGFLIKKKISPFGNNQKLLILRGLVGVTSMTFFFMSIKYLPVGTAVSLRYLAPIFAAIFAVILLKERIETLRWLFFILAFAGVIVLKGLDKQVDTYGLLLVLIASVFSGLVYIILGKIGNTEHPVVVVNYFMVTATIVGGILSIGNWTQPIGFEWVLLLSLGVFGYYGQLYMTKAFQSASATQIAPLKYIEVVFTLLLGVALFNEVYTFWSLLGMTMIIVALVLNTKYKSTH
ncbi:DMT family transporter [Namhaeicola litoreus]|uniref:DMT family transporter n=1 Tax=Namhaeicola litoreus TaxID=1052145 RepID=A0ABW3Y2Y1_9FLAO